MGQVLVSAIMDIEKDKQSILEKIRELMAQHHQKIESANVLTPDVKYRSEGYLEALYQVENVLINY